MLVGLQGSGKTTTAAKIANRLKAQNRKKVLLASLDVQRPAAQEQLAILGRQIGVTSLPIVPGERPVAITRRALQTGRTEGYDVVILDTAGRLHVNEELMLEVAAVREAANPHETLLVADAMTGQDAVNVAKAFGERAGITGIVLTRVDGDARGGAALSMRAITGKPIVLMGVGERIEALEPFHPERIAGRILGMGDVVSLVEKAAETVDEEEAEKLAAKLEKGRFDLDDLAAQLRQIRRMGGMGGMLKLLPGIGKIKKQLDEANIDERDHQAPRGDHLVDDQERAAQPQAAERLAPPAHRVGLGHHGAGNQPAPETVSGHGRHHQKDEEARPQGLGAARVGRTAAHRLAALGVCGTRTRVSGWR